MLDHVINRNSSLSVTTVNNLYEQLKIAEENNLEVTSRVTRIGLNQHIDSYVEMADGILSQMGRLLYLEPLFRALRDNGYKSDMHRIFEKNRNFYSPIARNTLRNIVGNEALFEGDVLAEHWANHKFFASKI